MDWDLVDRGRLAWMRCPSCQGGLDGGLMRQVEWAERRCVVVVACPSCSAECVAVLDVLRAAAPEGEPIDVDDVLAAHDLLARRAWRVAELFSA